MLSTNRRAGVAGSAQENDADSEVAGKVNSEVLQERGSNPQSA